MNAEVSVLCRAAEAFLVDAELDELQRLRRVKLPELLSVNIQQDVVSIIEPQSDIMSVGIDGGGQNFGWRITGPGDFQASIECAEFVSSTNGHANIAGVRPADQSSTLQSSAQRLNFPLAVKTVHPAGRINRKQVTSFASLTKTAQFGVRVKGPGNSRSKPRSGVQPVS